MDKEGWAVKTPWPSLSRDRDPSNLRMRFLAEQACRVGAVRKCPDSMLEHKDAPLPSGPLLTLDPELHHQREGHPGAELPGSGAETWRSRRRQGLRWAAGAGCSGPGEGDRGCSGREGQVLQDDKQTREQLPGHISDSVLFLRSNEQLCCHPGPPPSIHPGLTPSIHQALLLPPHPAPPPSIPVQPLLLPSTYPNSHPLSICPSIHVSTIHHPSTPLAPFHLSI